ncbi:MAG: class I SAM-dependent methyltransferase [Deltaproteobacteria bacterium]|jgi:SAM-dependent methyltransferase|nr:class I SAM-dependent methyltransferase [Deltaproteobacteria bacterium]
MLKRLLAHPQARGLAPDAPRTTELRRAIIRNKKFLYRIYEEWYGELIAAVPAPNTCPGRVLELGSGGGFLKDMLPECITSDVLLCNGVDMALDARSLPFADGSLRAILMVNVFHHIPESAAFLREASRVLAPGGVVAMWEPWNTPWSRVMNMHLHSEPFVPEAADWSFSSPGPLSEANGAMPWIVFERDKARFAEDFPALRLETLRLDYPCSYLVAGGVSMRALAPGCFFSFIRMLERCMSFLGNQSAMFAFITLRRETDNEGARQQVFPQFGRGRQ